MMNCKPQAFIEKAHGPSESGGRTGSVYHVCSSGDVQHRALSITNHQL